MSGIIKYAFKEHITKIQAKAEKEMLAEFEAGKFTFERPLVKQNVYLINPLSAVVLFRTAEETAVTVTVRGKTKEADIRHTFPKGTTHILPVLGLYANYKNSVEITLYQGQTATATIEVGDVLENVAVHRMETTPEYMQDNLIFLNPANANKAIGVDYAGDIRWHLTIPCAFDLKRLKNGNIIVGSDRLTRLPYYMSGLYEMSLVGKIYKEYRLPGGYHHDQFEMPDGSLLALTGDLNSDTVEDICVLIDRKTGGILKTWDYKNFLEPGLGKSGSWSEEDWFHNNAVWYDAITNSLTFSGRHMDIMPNIDFETGKLNWIIGDPEGWPREWVDKYFFKPAGEGDFDWQYEQHACVVTPNGDVMCFDNGHWRSKVMGKYLNSKENFSRGVRYKINTEDMTIEQVWQFGKERGYEFYSPYICNVEYYNEGHYLVHSGGICYVNGEPSEQLGSLVKDTDNAELKSITAEVYHDKVMMELETLGNYYRAEKLKLYSDGINLDMGEGSVLGSLDETKEFDTDIPAEAYGEFMPESCNASIQEEEDRLVFKSRFEKGQLVMLLLEGEEGTHRYYISTTAVSHLAMCVGTFYDTDERNTSICISKTGLKGAYDVRVIIEDKKYETGVKITC